MQKQINHILELWAEYDSICEEYNGLPLPEIENHDFVFESIIKGIALTPEIMQECRKKQEEQKIKNAQVKKIIYVIKNREKIEQAFSLLLQQGFTELEIKNNISFFDVAFALSTSELLDKLSFYLNILETKKNFLKAIYVATPIDDSRILSVEGEFSNSGGLLAINKSVFKNKLDAFAEKLELNIETAIEIFIATDVHMFRPAEKTERAIDNICNYFAISPKELAEILVSQPLFLTKDIKWFEMLKETLVKRFCISDEAAECVMIGYPDFVVDPYKSMDALLEKNVDSLPEIVKSKPWQYDICAEIISEYGYYDYGSYDAVLKYLEFIEATAGKIVRAFHGWLQPNSFYYSNNEEYLYTAILVKSNAVENTYYLISLGRGYRTVLRNVTQEKRLLSAIFGEYIQFSELIAKSPSPESEEMNQAVSDFLSICANDNRLEGYDFLGSTVHITNKIPADFSSKEQFEFLYQKRKCAFEFLEIT